MTILPPCPDGGYCELGGESCPFRRICMTDHTKPTRDNQIWHARRLLAEKGASELKRHAMVSQENRCTCGTCFCCAALFVYRQHIQESMR